MVDSMGDEYTNDGECKPDPVVEVEGAMKLIAASTASLFVLGSLLWYKF